MFIVTHFVTKLALATHPVYTVNIFLVSGFDYMMMMKTKKVSKPTKEREVKTVDSIPKQKRWIFSRA